jgi:hypothetical protein
VVVLSGAKYHISEKITLFTDRDGSAYVYENDLEGFFD